MRSWGSGEMIAVPKGAKESRVSGSGVRRRDDGAEVRIEVAIVRGGVVVIVIVVVVAAAVVVVRR